MKQNVNIVCVKYGTKYSSDRVDRLYRMVEKNCSLPFSFYCLTEDKSQKWRYPLDLDLDLESYWWKIQLFNLPWENPTLYFDLDVVIQNNIDSIFNKIQDNKLLIIDYKEGGNDTLNNIIIGNDPKINSSIIGFIPISVNQVYKRFIDDIDYNIVKYFGLDRFISDKFYDICHTLSFDQDFYYRWKPDGTASKYITKQMINDIERDIKHDPNKTVCVISQEHPDMYKGLEKYFL